MIDEKKTEQAEVVAAVKGARGELGVATAALTIKHGWHAKYFKRVYIKNKEGVVVRTFLEPNPGTPSLKQYARALAKDGDQTAKDWLSHKHGSMNAKRSDTNIKLAHECGAATKMQKRKKKGQN